LSKHGTGGRAASGAVGSVVGQIAKIKGCRVVGVGLLHLVELSAVAADQDDRAVLGQLFRQALAPRPPFWDTRPFLAKPKSLGPVPNVDA
jgi:hypothetical protein